MDTEREHEAQWNPDRPRIEADPLLRLMDERREVLDRRLDAIKLRGRTPRVCLYVLARSGSTPARFCEAARAYAEAQGWQSSSLQVFTDRLGVTDPLLRPSWSVARQQIRGGFVNGVVAVTYSAISLHLDEYALQLSFIDGGGGFLALVSAETGENR
ncbi:hypothetical protein ABII15_35895 [Streptomyces sp. HUAS MG91]|uniref:Uncharacterized protein n=1 Tax=Streptomyces tabacisoli TaxID=3156398 RepID=A0AAU8J467_9ACTN